MATMSDARRQAAVRRQRRPLRAVLVVASVALLALTVVSLATNDPLRRTSTRAVAATNGPSSASTAAGAAATQAGTASTAAAGASTSRGTTTAGVTTEPSVGAPPAGSPNGPSAPWTPSPTGPAPDTTTAIVSPTLRLFALGGRVMMPLICSVAASAAGPAFTDPNVAAIAGQIVSTCVAQANQGADGLLQLDKDLNQLAALNPAVRPALEQLAVALDSASKSSFPFASSLAQLAALVRFFRG